MQAVPGPDAARRSAPGAGPGAGGAGEGPGTLLGGSHRSHVAMEVGPGGRAGGVAGLNDRPERAAEDEARRAGEILAYLDAVSIACGEVMLNGGARRRLEGAGGVRVSVAYRQAGGELGGYGELELGGGAAAGGAAGIGRRWRGEQVTTAPGAGAAVLAALASSAAALAAAGWLELWARPATADADVAADAAALQRSRSLFRLLRPLPLEPPVAQAPVPDGALVRAFRPGSDEAAWLDVNARAFAALPDQASWTLEDLLAREVAPWFDPEDFVVLELGGHLAGFCWTKLHRVPGRAGAPLGEIYVIGVDPRAQGRGMGAALLRLGCASLERRGAEQVMLYVDAANAPALSLYDRAGFVRDREDGCYTGALRAHDADLGPRAGARPDTEQPGRRR